MNPMASRAGEGRTFWANSMSDWSKERMVGSETQLPDRDDLEPHAAMMLEDVGSFRQALANPLFPCGLIRGSAESIRIATGIL